MEGRRAPLSPVKDGVGGKPPSREGEEAEARAAAEEEEPCTMVQKPYDIET